MKVFILNAINLITDQKWIEIYFNKSEIESSFKFYYEKLKNEYKKIYRDSYQDNEFYLNKWKFKIAECNSGLQSEILTNLNKDISIENMWLEEGEN